MRAASVLVLGAVLVGCGKDQAPAALTATAKAPKIVGPAPAAVSSTLTYTYNPVGKRDPFRSPVEDVRAVQTLSNASCNEPLCKFDIDQLLLVAVVSGDANPVAMVQDPQGRGYLVHRNSKVGKQGGKVSQIFRDSLTVTEYFTGPDGKSNANNVTLAIRQEKEAPSETDLATGKIY